MKARSALSIPLTLSPVGGGLDDPIALEPEAFTGMVGGIRRLEDMGPDEGRSWLDGEYGPESVRAVLGDGVKRLAPSERKYYLTTNRSLHALAEIRAGQAIRGGDLCIVRSESNLRPGLGPEYLELVVGRTAQRTVPAGAGITWEDILPPVSGDGAHQASGPARGKGDPGPSPPPDAPPGGPPGGPLS